MALLLVLATVCTCVCCCVPAILKRHKDDDKQATEDDGTCNPNMIGIGVLAALMGIFLVVIISIVLNQSDTDAAKWWIFLLVLAAVCTGVCCCVLGILAKDNGHPNVALPLPIKIGIGVLAALIVILLLVIICPIDSDFLSGAKEWNKGSTTRSTSSDSSTISPSTMYTHNIGLFETNIKGTQTSCCDANGNSYETTYSDVTSDNSGKVKDAGDAAFGLIACTIILTLVAAVLVVLLPSPTALLVGIVLAVVAFILETAAWANWAHEVGNDDVDYGVCFIIAVLVWCFLLLFLLLMIFAYLKASSPKLATGKMGSIPITYGIGVLAAALSAALVAISLTSAEGGSDSDSWKWWMVFLVVLASVFSCMCCCVLAMLAKRPKGLEESACSPTLLNVAVGVLAALIVILLLVIICPIDSDFLSGAKEWNKGTTTVTSTSSDGATILAASNYSYNIGLYETNVKDTQTSCCDANGNSYETTYSDVTSDNSGKVKDAGDAAFGLIACTIILTLVAAVLVVLLPSPTALLVGIVLAVVAFILETAAWANWAHEVGNDDVDYGVCFIIAVLVWCFLLLFLLLMIFAYVTSTASATGSDADADGAADGVAFMMNADEKQYANSLQMKPDESIEFNNPLNQSGKLVRTACAHCPFAFVMLIYCVCSERCCSGVKGGTSNSSCGMHRKQILHVSIVQPFLA